MEIDVGRQQKAREYARIRRRLSFLDLGIAAAGLLLVFALGLDKWLRNVLHSAAFLGWQPVHNWFPVQILLYFLLAVLV